MPKQAFSHHNPHIRRFFTSLHAKADFFVLYPLYKKVSNSTSNSSIFSLIFHKSFLFQVSIFKIFLFGFFYKLRDFLFSSSPRFSFDLLYLVWKIFILVPYLNDYVQETLHLIEEKNYNCKIT